MHPNMIARSSGALAVGAAQSISTVPCIVSALTLRSGTTGASLTILDGGTAKWALSLIATTAAGDQTVSVTFPGGLQISGALTATVVGTGALGYIALKQ